MGSRKSNVTQVVAYPPTGAVPEAPVGKIETVRKLEAMFTEGTQVVNQGMGEGPALANAYQHLLGGKMVRDNAQDWWLNFPPAVRNTYHAISRPSVGALVIWIDPRGDGPGQIGVVVAMHASGFDTLEQGSEKGKGVHRYTRKKERNQRYLAPRLIGERMLAWEEEQGIERPEPLVEKWAGEPEREVGATTQAAPGEGQVIARLRAVERAWRDAGPHPEYHARVKESLKTLWPALHQALTVLME